MKSDVQEHQEEPQAPVQGQPVLVGVSALLEQAQALLVPEALLEQAGLGPSCSYVAATQSKMPSRRSSRASAVNTVF